MYLVTMHNIYTEEPQTREQIVNNLKSVGEVTFRQSRISNDFEFVIVNGDTVAKAFYTKEAQANYLAENDIL